MARQTATFERVGAIHLIDSTKSSPHERWPKSTDADRAPRLKRRGPTLWSDDRVEIRPFEGFQPPPTRGINDAAAVGLKSGTRVEETG